MIIAECPNCNAHIEVETAPMIGLPVECFNCHVDLEVTWLYPITLDFPERQRPQIQELELHEKH